MTEEGKVEQTEDLEVVDDANDHPEGEPAAITLPKEPEPGKDDDDLKDDAEVEYRRRSFHAKPYTSKTVEQTEKEVQELIVKPTRLV